MKINFHFEDDSYRGCSFDLRESDTGKAVFFFAEIQDQNLKNVAYAVGTVDEVKHRLLKHTLKIISEAIK
ncbi:MAG: hypothetical protein IKG61_01350 [Selenomonadaceae bacterium]|nr:hypothetical protein [Selenomonadaceae bacterium]MBR3050082.1 hypothetical protein [Selenomonadaceae bacterium]